MRIDPTMPQKEETFQVVRDNIKASPCFKVFTITANVPDIYMQQFWFTIKKTKKTQFYEFGLANKKFSADVELFRKILDICPRVPNEDFVAPPSEEDLLAFLFELGYKAIGYLARMFVNHMHQPWRTLATIINKCLSGRRPSMTDFDNQELQSFREYFTGRIRTLRNQPHTGGSSEGTGITPGVPDELTGICKSSSEGTSNQPRVPDEVKGSSEVKVDFVIDWGSKESEYSKEDKTDDDEETDDEYMHDDDYVHKDVDEEMKDAKVAVTGKDDDESHTLLNVHVSVIHEQPVPTSSPALTTETPISTVPPPPPIVSTISSIQQLSTPIPTPPITTIATSVTTTVLDPLPAIVQRVFELEKDVQELKQDEHKSDRMFPEQPNQRKRDHGDDKDRDPYVIMDAANDNVVNDADQPQDDSVPKTDTALRNNLFKKPRPPTPNPKWNNVQAVDDS
ncbi:hypothetical protein Tco_1300969 [Tanacetum coccineum]